jgi:hypothetical protein
MIFMDLETFSLANLKRVGGRAYANDPSTKIMCACFLVDGVYKLWVPYPCARIHWPKGIPPGELEYGPDFESLGIPTDRPWVAHNADEFDSLVWGRRGPVQPVGWVDTLPKCRLAGYPGSLDALSERFIGIGKDATATRILKKVCVSDKPPGPGHLAVIASYNIADVAALKVIYDRVERYSEEPGYSVHRRINERGIAFDRRLAGDLLRLSTENVHRAAAKIEALTGGKIKRADLTRRNHILAWCEEQGLRLPSLRREVVQQLIDDPDELLQEILNASDGDVPDDRGAECPEIGSGRLSDSAGCYAGLDEFLATPLAGDVGS